MNCPECGGRILSAEERELLAEVGSKRGLQPDDVAVESWWDHGRDTFYIKVRVTIHEESTGLVIGKRGFILRLSAEELEATEEVLPTGEYPTVRLTPQ